MTPTYTAQTAPRAGGVEGLDLGRTAYLYRYDGRPGFPVEHDDGPIGVVFAARNDAHALDVYRARVIGWHADVPGGCGSDPPPGWRVIARPSASESIWADASQGPEMSP